MPAAVYHRSPSGPTVMALMLLGTALPLTAGTGYSVTDPDVMMLPIAGPDGASSENHKSPPGPDMMNAGWPPDGTGYSVTDPDVVIAPIASLPLSANHTFRPAPP